MVPGATTLDQRECVFGNSRLDPRNRSARVSDSHEEVYLATRDVSLPPTFVFAAASINGHCQVDARSSSASCSASHVIHTGPQAQVTKEVASPGNTIPIGCNSGGLQAHQVADIEASLLDSFSVISWNVLSLGEKDSAKGINPLKQTGQLTFLCKRLLEEGILIAFIQESRLNLPAEFETSTHKVIQNPAEKGVGGLLTIVAKGIGVKVVNHRLYGGRVLAVTISYKGIVLYTINAHGPIRKASEQAHAEFARHISGALAGKPQDALLIGGCDLNTRMAHTPEDVSISGPLASVCPYKARHAQQLMRARHQHGAFLANTFVNTVKGGSEVHGNACMTVNTRDQLIANGPADDPEHETPLSEAVHDSISTWCHPQSKRVFQIDFIVTCSKALDAISACSTLPWSHFDVLTCSDHRALTATFVMRNRVNAKIAPRPPRKHSSPEHLAAFKANIAAKMRDFQCGTGAPPLEVTHELQNMAVEALRVTKPKKAQPRKEWISKGTWKHMRLLNQLRKLLKARKAEAAVLNHLFPIELLPARGAPPGLSLPCTIS
eukprot:193145-Amphidinium_carterae.1